MHLKFNILTDHILKRNYQFGYCGPCVFGMHYNKKQKTLFSILLYLCLYIIEPQNKNTLILFQIKYIIHYE